MAAASCPSAAHSALPSRRRRAGQSPCPAQLARRSPAFSADPSGGGSCSRRARSSRRPRTGSRSGTWRERPYFQGERPRFGVREHEHRIGVVDDVCRLLSGQSVVQRHRHRANLARRHAGRHLPGRVGAAPDDPVPRFCTPIAKDAAEAVGVGFELCERPADERAVRAIVDDRGTVALALSEESEEICHGCYLGHPSFVAESTPKPNPQRKLQRRAGACTLGGAGGEPSVFFFDNGTFLDLIQPTDDSSLIAGSLGKLGRPRKQRHTRGEAHGVSRPVIPSSSRLRGYEMTGDGIMTDGALGSAGNQESASTIDSKQRSEPDDTLSSSGRGCDENTAMTTSAFGLT